MKFWLICKAGTREEFTKCWKVRVGVTRVRAVSTDVKRESEVRKTGYGSVQTKSMLTNLLLFLLTRMC